MALRPLRVALGVAGLHLWVHLWVARVGLLWLLLGVGRVLPRLPRLPGVAAAVAGVLPGRRPAPLLVVALGHRLARVPVHALLLLHLLLLLPRHVGGVLALLPGVAWLPRLALVAGVARLALGGPSASGGVAWGATGAIGAIAGGELAPLAPPAPVPLELLLLLLLLAGVALHLLRVARLLALLLLLLEVFGAPGTEQLELAGGPGGPGGLPAAPTVYLVAPGAEAAEVAQSVQAGEVIPEQIWVEGR